jgi:hypothetical protein
MGWDYRGELDFGAYRGRAAGLRVRCACGGRERCAGAVRAAAERVARALCVLGLAGGGIYRAGVN